MGGLQLTGQHATSVLATGNVHSGLDPATQFYVPKPDQAATDQIATLTATGHKSDAALIRTMIGTPQAVWFTSGTPQSVQQDVKSTVLRAAGKGTVPVLVAYNIPGRDCAQYSAGGAATGDAYKAWIRGFAAGLGTQKAVVLVEPDGLANLPTDCGQPDTYDRIGLIKYAADALLSDPNALIYLDAGHSAWHSVGDMAARLVQAGVQDVNGFFLNVSNYQPTPNLVKYGTWISGCIAFANDPEEGGWRLGHYDYCASQYYPANPNDFSTWHLTDEWYASNLGSAIPTTHFVIDTSRNGQGPNNMSAYAGAPYNQPASVIYALQAGNWCNPPGSGLGPQPTANTGVALVDAYLWVKIPGQSDGQCDAAGGVRAWDYSAYTASGWPSDAAHQALFDPLWGLYDPAAGQWFPEMALELAQKASPPLAQP
jgi:endoglucanase